MNIKSLRIAFIGWARLQKQEQEGSGYNLVASELALGLTQAGHQLFYLNSGRNYSLIPKIYIGKIQEWKGIQCYSLFNSPNFSPGRLNFGNLKSELSSCQMNQLVIRWLIQLKIDIVHIHSQEGYPLDLIPNIRKNTGLPIIVTPHDYWYICPQVNLLYQELEICQDYQGGLKCLTCVSKNNLWNTKLKRLSVNLIENYGGNKLLAIMSYIYNKLIGKKKEKNYSDHYLDTPIYPLNQNQIFLDTQSIPLIVNNDYGKRRRLGIEALNSATLVTPPSQFLSDVHKSMGLQSNKIELIRLGLSHLDQISQGVKNSPYYTIQPWNSKSSNRPLRFGFLGTTSTTKGLSIFTQAIINLPTEIRQRCHFIIRASGKTDFFRQLIGYYPEVSFASRYRVSDLPTIIHEYDIAIIPHVWFENSPITLLENLHAGKFTIASSLGGVLEWIKPPQNGLLFEAGNSISLAACIERVLTGEVYIPSPNEVHQVSELQSCENYINENISIYQNSIKIQK
jgi:glycosyltransferase involved in cell wall biosynthesis